MRALAIAASATAGLLLAGCSASAPPEPAPEPEVLSASEAGGLYLDAVCPVNAVWDEVDVELDRLRLTVSRGEDDTRRFAAALNELAAASKTAAHNLDPKTLDKAGHVWPEGALDQIAAVQQTLVADQKQAATVAKLDAHEIVNYSWKGAETVGTAASEARAALGLPEDGESACTQWQEQAVAEAAAEKEAANLGKPEPGAPKDPDSKAGTKQ